LELVIVITREIVCLAGNGATTYLLSGVFGWTATTGSISEIFNVKVVDISV